jgi:hypothetical protein
MKPSWSLNKERKSLTRLYHSYLLNAGLDELEKIRKNKEAQKNRKLKKIERLMIEPIITSQMGRNE